MGGAALQRPCAPRQIRGRTHGTQRAAGEEPLRAALVCAAVDTGDCLMCAAGDGGDSSPPPLKSVFMFPVCAVMAARCCACACCSLNHSGMQRQRDDFQVLSVPCNKAQRPDMITQLSPPLKGP